jgi:hypothetical protein
LPIWVAGLIFYFSIPGGRRYRLLGWLYLIPLVIFIVLRGRSYYLAPAYPMLLAGGAVAWEGWLAGWGRTARRVVVGIAWGAIAAGALVSAALGLPIAPINSPLWEITSEVHDNFVEQIGWPELVATVAEVYHALPAEEQAATGIFTNNYGEAGAVNLYGPAHGLPEAISGVNSYWLRGPGDPPPEIVIVLGFRREWLDEFFTDCELAAQVTNPYGVENEETRNYDGVFLCRGTVAPWPELWPQMKHFG